MAAEIERDPDFKHQLRQHEIRPEIDVLRSLLAAAREPKQWSASAWFLERLYARRYAARKADAIRPAALRAMLNLLEQQLAADLPKNKQWRQLLRQLRKR